MHSTLSNQVWHNQLDPQNWKGTGRTSRGQIPWQAHGAAGHPTFLSVPRSPDTFQDMTLNIGPFGSGFRMLSSYRGPAVATVCLQSRSTWAPMGCIPAGPRQQQLKLCKKIPTNAMHTMGAHSLAPLPPHTHLPLACTIRTHTRKYKTAAVATVQAL